MDLVLEEALFASAGEPLSYPGSSPSQPYLVHGAKGTQLKWKADRLMVAETSQGVDDYLERLGSVPIAERTAQIAYGANRDMRNLAWKLKAYAESEGSSTVAIALPATLADADIVASNVGYWGYVYGAALLHRPPALNRVYLAGSQVEVILLLLDQEQVKAMHRSEGVPIDKAAQRADVSCNVAITRCKVSGPDIEVAAQLYVPSLPFMSLNGHTPLPFLKVVRQGGAPLRRFSQRELWAAIATRLGLEHPEDIVAMLRRGALARAEGDPGPSDETLELYLKIRCEILSSMRMADRDGRVRTGLDDVHSLLQHDLAWAGKPRIGRSVRG